MRISLPALVVDRRASSLWGLGGKPVALVLFLQYCAHTTRNRTGPYVRKKNSSPTAAERNSTSKLSREEKDSSSTSRPKRTNQRREKGEQGVAVFLCFSFRLFACAKFSASRNIFFFNFFHRASAAPARGGAGRRSFCFFGLHESIVEVCHL